MTEDEARTKWCPHRRYLRNGLAADFQKQEQVSCIASDCMMWRARDVVVGQKYVPGGYCGLAGGG